MESRENREMRQTVVACSTADVFYIVYACSCCMKLLQVFVAAPWNRAGHYIFALWYLTFFLA